MYVCMYVCIRLNSVIVLLYIFLPAINTMARCLFVQSLNVQLSSSFSVFITLQALSASVHIF